MEPQHIVSIDEHHSRKVIRIEDRPTITREERFRRLTEAGVQTRAAEPAKIQKVIFLLRDHKHFVKYFEPRVAAVGPIHHGNPKYRLGEEYKLVLASKFVDRSGKRINLLYEEAEMEIKQLRGCFEEEVTKNYDDEALTWILFVDGCAILQYIFCAANNKFEELNIKIDSVAFAQQDLFLLENQVPYCLLKLLMNLSGNEDELSKSIERFIESVTYQQTTPQQKGESSGSQPKQPKQPTHLLDLLRTRLLGPLGSSKSDPPSGKTRGIWPCRKKGKEDPDWQSYRNVQELKSVGIKLQPSKNNSNLRNISFTRKLGFFPGYLWLPPITVDDSTGPKFMNLIAYEMCLDFENDFGISSYISLLDSLIDEANDVKDLRKAQVLHNFLGSDQEVADLFNEIGTDVVPNADAYKDVKRHIQEYYKIPCMTWMAQVYHNHFSSPWTFLAFLGVLLGLGLTAAQTWYAVKASHPGPCEKFCKLKLKET
ncbi:UPF0481 protein At3g47200-like [Corylus avellana]|uniref:UPF0481 protein At3g47200-like n=1 Tax=Corylus avellana TaxID=13451 RepID=UPI00286D04ED|nr:UPF0481 protein At3g47200-like [Corylus avellana]